MIKQNDFKNLKDKKLLVIAPSFANENNIFIRGIFVKTQLESLKKYFKEITVIAPVLFSFKILGKDKLCKNYSYDNIKVYYPRCFYTPVFNFKILIDNRFRVVENLIKKENIEFDLIHAHFAWPAGYIGVKLKEKYGVPFIVTVHGYDIYDLPFRDREWKEKIEYVLNAADYDITVSNSNLECINKLNVKTPVKVIPNGFNCDLFYPRKINDCRKTLNFPPDKMIILTVGSLVEVKGHKYLIETMKEVAKQRKDVLCIIVGGGKLKGKLERQIRKAGLEDHVKLVGGRPHDEIPIWMNACDLFVLPSLSEGNPTVMFECLGCGKPVIGTKVGGVPEIITSEDYGFLVEPANPKALAEKILIALDKEWDYEKILRYAERFTWERIAKEVLKVYESLLM
jgi:glycosyltransferase involved in cell wall biosynthesis